MRFKQSCTVVTSLTELLSLALLKGLLRERKASIAKFYMTFADLLHRYQIDDEATLFLSILLCHILPVTDIPVHEQSGLLKVVTSAYDFHHNNSTVATSKQQTLIVTLSPPTEDNTKSHKAFSNSSNIDDTSTSSAQLTLE